MKPKVIKKAVKPDNTHKEDLRDIKRRLGALMALIDEKLKKKEETENGRRG